MATQRLVDGDTTLALGMNSLLHPSQLDPGFFAQSMNTLNRGGIVQTRPGYRCLFAMPDGKLQAMVLFRPKQAAEQIVFVVDGQVYVSDIPFTSYRLLTNVLLADTADQVQWVVAEKSVETNEDGSLSFITPKSVLILQDGVSPPVYFDGSESGHLRNTNPILNTLTPLGGPMAWVGDRLWVARGSKVFASDIADPFSFTDDTYLGGVPYFILPDDVTAMAVLPSIQYQQLLVFTRDSTTLFQANIRDRSSWANTADFQKVVLPNVGCIAPKSIHAHYGLLWWFSNFGLTSLDAASVTSNTSRLPYSDNEMSVSKGRLDGNLSGVVVSSFENYLMVSVPYGDAYNRHTWVLDNSVADTLVGKLPSVWNTYWTGTRPVEWSSGEVQGVQRIFHASVDYDGVNRLWEAFLPERRDNGCPITCTFESRGYFSKLPLQDKEYRYADLFFTELIGDVDIGVFWGGASRGPYKQVVAKRVHCTQGSLRYDRELVADEDVFSLKKQSRRIRTQDVRLLDEDNQTSCGLEYKTRETIDDSFQLFIVWSGEAALSGLRMFFDPVNDDLSAKCEEDEDDGKERAVRFDGESMVGTLDDVLDTLAVGPTVYTANVTVVDSVKGIQSVQTGNGASVISQKDANKIADSEARARIARELEQTVPPVLGGVEESCL